MDVGLPPSDARARVRGLPDDPLGFASILGRTANRTEPVVRRDNVGPSERERPKGRRAVTPGLPSASDLFVRSLPGLPNMATHPTHPLVVHAGNLPSDPGDGRGGGDGATGRDAKLFFLMIKARRSAGKQRVVFWFNGGPGCSSFDGSLMEVGPFRTVPASQTSSGMVELRLVEGGWEEFATIVFVDQPPGTGFSYTPTNGYLHELDQGSAHLIQFMQNFYSIFPEYQGVDTYLAGESFAGQYIPYFADALVKTTLLPDLQFKGIAIGNGWIDPMQQYTGYADFAYEKGLIKPGTPEADNVNAAVARCDASRARYPDANGFTPVNIPDCDVMYAVTSPFDQELNGKKTCMNVYDVRLVDDWPACGMNWPPDLSDVYTFLRYPQVVSALHASAHETAWVECDGRVASELHLHTSTAAVDLIPGILAAGVQVMMFAGAEDLICNYKGIERMLDYMHWGGVTGMSNSTREGWFLNGTQVGEWQEARNMTYVKVYAGSHMVGFDLPAVTSDMITRFMGVDYGALPGHQATSPSKVGDEDRVVVGLGKEEGKGGMALLKGGKTDWEAWYNAISAFLILFILLGIVALYFYFRRRGRVRRRVALGTGRDREADAAERVPLGRVDPDAAEEYELDDAERGGGGGGRSPGKVGKGKGRGKGKGKGRGEARKRDGWEDGEEEGEGSPREVVFALGDDEDR